MTEPDSNAGTTQPQRGMATLLAYASCHKIDVALWLTRLVTMYMTFLYFFPLFGAEPYLSYQRALLSNAATCALRLHQRLPPVQLSREFLVRFCMEDSSHYLFFSLIFLYAHASTLALLPVFLFAMLHAASYTLTLLDQMGRNSWWGARYLISFVEFQQRNILRLIALTEIFLMLVVIIMAFTGRANLFIPFMYYRFLSLRYSSRRNPFTRQMFHELRLAIELQLQRPACPQAIRNLGHKIIGFISRFAPPVTQ